MQRKGECLFAYDAPVAFQIQLSLTRTSVQRPCTDTTMCLYRHSKLSELLLPKSCTDTTMCLWCSKSNFVWLWLPTSFS